MRKEAEELRRELARVETGRGKRYLAELRQRVVAWATRRNRILTDPAPKLRIIVPRAEPAGAVQFGGELELAAAQPLPDQTAINLLAHAAVPRVDQILKQVAVRQQHAEQVAEHVMMIDPHFPRGRIRFRLELAIGAVAEDEGAVSEQAILSS